MKKINKNLLQSCGERIRAERLKLGLTQDELATALKLSRQQIHNYELEKRQPDYTTLRKIANFFDVSIDYLLGNIESKKVENIDISDTLGLTDISIEKLSTFAKKDAWNSDYFSNSKAGTKYYSIIINKIIESEKFEDLLYCIRQYIYSFQIDKLNNEIRMNQIVDIDPDTGITTTARDLIIQDENYNEETELSSTDMYAFKINTLFGKILENVTNQLEPSLSTYWSLNKDKTEIVHICKDGSDNLFKKEKNNGNKRNNKK